MLVSIWGSYRQTTVISGSNSRDIDPMLFYCWASVADSGSTVKQHWFSVSGTGSRFIQIPAPLCPTNPSLLNPDGYWEWHCDCDWGLKIGIQCERGGGGYKRVSLFFHRPWFPACGTHKSPPPLYRNLYWSSTTNPVEVRMIPWGGRDTGHYYVPGSGRSLILSRLPRTSYTRLTFCVLNRKI